MYFSWLTIDAHDGKFSNVDFKYKVKVQENILRSYASWCLCKILSPRYKVYFADFDQVGFFYTAEKGFNPPPPPPPSDLMTFFGYKDPTLHPLPVIPYYQITFLYIVFYVHYFSF